MNTLLRRPPTSAEDFEAMSDNSGYEWVGDRLREMPSGAESSWIAGVLIALLGPAVRTGRIGLLFPQETMYRCFPRDAKAVRKPDVSVIRLGRLPNDRPPRGVISIPPDLAVEVTSPNETVGELDAKVGDYLSAGVAAVWVLNPDTRSVHVYAPDGTARRLTIADELFGDPVIPGFRVAVADLFPFPPEPADPTGETP
ncbi:MAG: Uma2 family endonuclease [Fimbriiglobus sp.]